MEDDGQKWEKFQLNLANSQHGELYGYLLMLVGIMVSAVIQSSSAFTSMLVPLAANQIICLNCAYALTLGGNIGKIQTILLFWYFVANVNLQEPQALLSSQHCPKNQKMFPKLYRFF